MATLPFPNLRPAPSRNLVEQALLAGVSALVLLLVVALARRLTSGMIVLPREHSVWLAVHLAAVIPALPLGGYILWRRKGDRLHKMLGRTWAALMLLTALSSFGLHGLTGRLSWIHILSVVVLVSVPRGVILAMRGNIPAHKNAILRVYAGLVIAGFFTFLPGRLLGQWLFG